jgi:hypothetical protein
MGEKNLPFHAYPRPLAGDPWSIMLVEPGSCGYARGSEQRTALD